MFIDVFRAPRTMSVIQQILINNTSFTEINNFILIYNGAIAQSHHLLIYEDTEQAFSDTDLTECFVKAERIFFKIGRKDYSLHELWFSDFILSRISIPLTILISR